MRDWEKRENLDMKLKARIEFVLEWELSPKVYPEGSTPEEMAKIDEQNIYEDPVEFIQNFMAYEMGKLTQDVQVEVVKEGE